MVSKTEQYLMNIANRMGNGSVSVGFAEGRGYADGTSLAQVAFQNEFGAPSKGQPARPFFRRMVAKEAPGWAPQIGRLAAEGRSGANILRVMGEDIRGGIMDSINNFTDPPLSPETIARKGFSKPLIDSHYMVDNVTYTVDD